MVRSRVEGNMERENLPFAKHRLCNNGETLHDGVVFSNWPLVTDS